MKYGSSIRSLIRKDKKKLKLRIPDSYDAKIAEICYLWTFCPVIQLKSHIFEIRQKAFFHNAPYM